MYVRINVTEEDIANGVQKQANACAIALAIKRELPPDSEVAIRYHFAQAWVPCGDGEEQRYCARLPQEAASFIRVFDRNKKVEPLRFNLDFELVERVQVRRPKAKQS